MQHDQERPASPLRLRRRPANTTLRIDHRSPFLALPPAWYYPGHYSLNLYVMLLTFVDRFLVGRNNPAGFRSWLLDAFL